MKKKIISVSQSSDLIKKLKKKSKKIVLCHGVFDILHSGHIYHFQKAKKFGDILIVSLTADKFVKKGPGRPKFNIKERSNVISNLSIVDFVIINNDSDSINLIKKIKPNIYVKGIDYKNFKNDVSSKIQLEKKAIQSVGGILKFTNEKTTSTFCCISF